MPIKLNPYTESGTTYNNYYMFLMDFLTYRGKPNLDYSQDCPELHLQYSSNNPILAPTVSTSTVIS